MFERTLNLSKKRIQRIGISFVLFFALINAVLYFFMPSYKQTGRASEFFLDLNICNFSDKDFSEITKLIKNDIRPKIFVLGDSVSYGIGIKEDESVSGQLRFTQDDYAVYNLSVCGAKPLDFLLWIQYLDEIDEVKKNIYLVQYNYKWFGLNEDDIENVISQKKTLQYFQKYLSEDIKTQLNISFGRLDNFKFEAGKNIPVVSSRTALFALVFREKSKEDLIRHIFFGGHEKPSFEEKKKNFNCRIDYSSPIWTEDYFNYNIYLKTVDLISEKGLRAYLFMPPYNEQITSRCQDTTFNTNIDKFLNDAAAKNVSALQFIKDVPPKMFLDDMHLTEQGSRILAEKLINIILNHENII